MSALRRVLVTALVPLALSGCSSHSTAAPRPTPTTTATQAALPVATSYVVTAKPGVSKADLRAALDRIAKIPGLRGVSLQGNNGLRVDLSFVPNEEQRKAVLAQLYPLGVVTVP